MKARQLAPFVPPVGSRVGPPRPVRTGPSVLRRVSVAALCLFSELRADLLSSVLAVCGAVFLGGAVYLALDPPDAWRSAAHAARLPPPQKPCVSRPSQPPPQVRPRPVAESESDRKERESQEMADRLRRFADQVDAARRRERKAEKEKKQPEKDQGCKGGK